MKATTNSVGCGRFQEKSSELPIAYSCIQDFLAEFPEEGHLLLSHHEKKQVEREQRVQRIADSLVKGQDTFTLDLGCMSGQMTKSIRTLTGGQVVGIDSDVISVAKAMANGSIDYIVANFLEWDIPSNLIGRFHQIVASHFLHELYSKYGETGFNQAIRKAKLLLKKGGKLIITDGVHPENESAPVRFRDIQTLEQFRRFTDRYNARNISYNVQRDGIINIDQAEFARFLNCLKFVLPGDLRDYEYTLRSIHRGDEKIARAYYILDYYTLPASTYSSEFEQDFTFYAKDKWLESLQSLGFRVDSLKLYNERRTEECFWRSGIEFPVKVPKIYIKIVVAT
jgi:SAM-dependent methyltransferase